MKDTSPASGSQRYTGKETRVKESLGLYHRAEQRVAGVTHLFGRRAELHAFGYSPLYSARQYGGRFLDVDGNEYIDYNLGTGAVILGHAYEPVVRAVQQQAAAGTGLSVNHPLEVEVAELLRELVQCAEMSRFVKGGGEANAVAIRIARAATGRDKVVYCGYHGWHDWYLSAGLHSAPTLERHLQPGITPTGVPSALRDTTMAFAYNDADSLEALLDEHHGEVACVILEPARTYQPDHGFLEAVREITRRRGVVLIFDEVVTGFRVSSGGAQQLYGVTPDLATFAKAISNGFSFGAVAGRADVMKAAGDTFISSVYWAEATGLAAARATLSEFLRKDVCAIVQNYGERFLSAIRAIVQTTGLPLIQVGFASFPTLRFDGVEPAFANELVTLYLQETARRGVYGGPYFYFCMEHDEHDFGQSVAALSESLGVVSKAWKDGATAGYLNCPVRQAGFRRLV